MCTTVDGGTNCVTERMRRESEHDYQKLQEYCHDHHLSNIAPSLPFLPSCPVNVAQYLQQHDIDTVLFDCDGVLYRSPDAAPGAAAALQTLQSTHRRYYFVTNNSAANPRQLRDKLASLLGIHGNETSNSSLLLQQEQMISTALTTAQYLRQTLLDDHQHHASSTCTVYVIGSDGLRDEIRRTGIQVLETHEEPAGMTREELAAYDFDDKVDAVVVGHDVDFNFRKLCLATVLLQRNPQALLVATNMDAYDLVGADGRHLPGNGALVQAIAFSSGRIVHDCGKPSPFLAEFITTVCQVDPSRTLFVGDRLDTDIQFAVDNGMHAALVLTGVTTVNQLQDLLALVSERGTHHDKDGKLPLPTLVMPHVGFLALEDERLV